MNSGAEMVQAHRQRRVSLIGLEVDRTLVKLAQERACVIMPAEVFAREPGHGGFRPVGDQLDGVCGVERGQRDLAAFAGTLSKGQLRALKFRRDRHTGAIRCPDETTFFRVLHGVDERVLEQALLAWQEQLLGPAQDTLIATDGKKLRHAQGVELVSAFGMQSGRWLGTVCTEAKSNEPNGVRSPARQLPGSPKGSAGGRWQIPAARELLGRLDLAGKTVVADALHTQVETARQIVFEGGGDYIFTVKDNQKTLHQTVAGLLEVCV